MAHAIVKKTFSKDDIEIAHPISAQDQVPEVLKPQELVKAESKNQAKLQTPIKQIKFNARISEEFICINNYYPL